MKGKKWIAKEKTACAARKEKRLADDRLWRRAATPPLGVRVDAPSHREKIE